MTLLWMWNWNFRILTKRSKRAEREEMMLSGRREDFVHVLKGLTVGRYFSFRHPFQHRHHFLLEVS